MKKRDAKGKKTGMAAFFLFSFFYFKHRESFFFPGSCKPMKPISSLSSFLSTCSYSSSFAHLFVQLSLLTEQTLSVLLDSRNIPEKQDRESPCLNARQSQIMRHGLKV